MKKLSLILCFFITSACFSAENQTMTMPAMPSMPVTMHPTVGSGFYTPGSAGFYSGSRIYNPSYTQPKKSESNNTPKEKKESTQKQNLDMLFQDLTTPEAPVLKQMKFGNQNAITASDLNSLNSMGILGSFSSVLGNSVFSTENYSSATSSENQNAVLTKILNGLNDIKRQTVDSETSLKKAATFSTPSKQGSQILRFKIDGQNILSSCKDIYISDRESDGSFLVTGDRKYVSKGFSLDETFYILFKSNGSRDSTTTYEVQTDLSQNFENKDSLLYKLGLKDKLSASKTGNLVTLKSNSAGFLADLLISLEN